MLVGEFRRPRGAAFRLVALVVLIGVVSGIIRNDYNTMDTGCDERCLCQYVLNYVNHERKQHFTLPVKVANCDKGTRSGCTCRLYKKKQVHCSMMIAKCSGIDEKECPTGGCVCEYDVAAWKLTKKGAKKYYFKREVPYAPFETGCNQNMYTWCACKQVIGVKDEMCELEVYTCEKRQVA